MYQRPKYKAKNVKLLKEKNRVNFCDLVLRNGFLDMTHKAQTTEKKWVNWNVCR